MGYEIVTIKFTSLNDEYSFVVEVDDVDAFIKKARSLCRNNDKETFDVGHVIEVLEDTFHCWNADNHIISVK